MKKYSKETKLAAVHSYLPSQSYLDGNIDIKG